MSFLSRLSSHKIHDARFRRWNEIRDSHAALGCSFNMSTQGAYVQDFPIKKSMNSSSGAFENTLIEYCKSYEEAGRNLYFRDKEPKLFQGLSRNLNVGLVSVLIER